MRLPKRLVAAILEVAQQRPPDFVVGNAADPYMRRWWLLPRNPVFNVYLHHFLHSDDDRALHDHPWYSLSFLLRGELIEWTFAEPSKGEAGGFWQRLLQEGAVTWRAPHMAHRLELLDSIVSSDGLSVSRAPAQPASTLFITGPRLRAWGFHCPRGWVPWQQFTAPHAKGEVGRGCG